MCLFQLQEAALGWRDPADCSRGTCLGNRRWYVQHRINVGQVRTNTYGSFTFTETYSDSNSKPNGCIAQCRKCSHCTNWDSDPYSIFLKRTGIRVRVCTWVRLRQCKWALTACSRCSAHWVGATKKFKHFWYLSSLFECSAKVIIRGHRGKDNVCHTVVKMYFSQLYLLLRHDFCHLESKSETDQNKQNKDANMRYKLIFATLDWKPSTMFKYVQSWTWSTTVSSRGGWVWRLSGRWTREPRYTGPPF